MFITFICLIILFSNISFNNGFINKCNKDNSIQPCTTLYNRFPIIRNSGVTSNKIKLLDSIKFINKKISFPIACFALTSILTTFIDSTSYTAVVTSNAYYFVEEMGWKLLLPSSLILSIIGVAEKDSIFDKHQVSNNANKKAKLFRINFLSSLVRYIQHPISVSFILGSIGSVLGGICGFRISIEFISSNSNYSSKILNTRVTNFNSDSFQVNIQQLLLCAASLTSSYIGGTANFFETAHQILNSYDPSQESMITQIRRSATNFASADVGIMILYFNLLNWIRIVASKIYHYPKSNIKNYSPAVLTRSYNTTCNSNDLQLVNRSMLESNDTEYLLFEEWWRISLLVSIALVLAQSSNFLQRLLNVALTKLMSSSTNVSGISVMVATLEAVSISRAISRCGKKMDIRDDNEVDKSASKTNTSFFNIFLNKALAFIGIKELLEDSCHLRKLASGIYYIGDLFARTITLVLRLYWYFFLVGGEILVCGFYLILGLQARWQSLVELGFPSILLFAAMLFCHLGFLLLSALLWNRYLVPIAVLFSNMFHTQPKILENDSDTTKDVNLTVPGYHFFHLSLDDVLIASNACVGGAATAVSMAARFAKEGQNEKRIGMMIKSNSRNCSKKDLNSKIAMNTTSSYNTMESSLHLNVVMASIVGIAGYIVGTPIGLLTAKYLHTVLS